MHDFYILKGVTLIEIHCSHQNYANEIDIYKNIFHHVLALYTYFYVIING